MRLFLALLRKKMPNGHIHRGKYRLVKEVTGADCSKLRCDFEIEERNMFLLRHPYLSPEQTKGHTAIYNRKQENFLAVKTQQKRLKDHVRLEDRLGHVRYQEAWE